MVEMESNMSEDLHRASEAGDTERMKILLRRGTTVNSESAQRSFLQQAVRSGDQELLTMLLQHNIQLLTDPVTITELLQNAAEDGDINLLRLLLEHGARGHINYTIPGVKDTALHLAVRGSHLEAVQLLLDHSADVTALTSTRRCCYGDNDSFDFFVDENVTALHLVAEVGCFDVTEVLLSKGCAVNAMTVHGYTALHLAVLENHDDIVRLLLQYGARLSLLTQEGESVVDIATRRCYTTVLRTLELHMTTIMTISTEATSDKAERLWITQHLKGNLKRKRKGNKKSLKQRRISAEDYTMDEAAAAGSDRSQSHGEGDETSVVTLVGNQDAPRQIMPQCANEYSSGVADGDALCTASSTAPLSGKAADGTVTGSLILLKIETQSQTEVHGVPFTRSHRRESRDAISHHGGSVSCVSASGNKPEGSSTEVSTSIDDTLSSSWDSLEARPIIGGSVNIKSQRSSPGSVNQCSTGSTDPPNSKCISTKRVSFQETLSIASEDSHHGSSVSSMHSLIPFADEHVDEHESPNVRYQYMSDDEVFHELDKVQANISAQALQGKIEARWTKEGDIEMVITEGDNASVSNANGGYNHSDLSASANLGQIGKDIRKTSDTSDDESQYHDALSTLPEEVAPMKSTSQEDEPNISDISPDESDEEEYLNDQTMRAAITFFQTKCAYDSEDSSSDTVGDNDESEETETRDSTLEVLSKTDTQSGQKIEMSKDLFHFDKTENRAGDEKVTQVHHDNATTQQIFIGQLGTHDTKYSGEQDTNLLVHRIPSATTEKTSVKGGTHAKDMHHQVNRPGRGQLEINPENHHRAQNDNSSTHLHAAPSNVRKLENANITGSLVLLKTEEDTNLEVNTRTFTSTQQASIREIQHAANTPCDVNAPDRSKVESKIRHHYEGQAEVSSINMQDPTLNQWKQEDVFVTGGLVLVNVKHDTNLEVYRVPLGQKEQVSFSEKGDEVLECKTEQETGFQDQDVIQCQIQRDAQYKIEHGGQHHVEPRYSQDVTNQMLTQYESHLEVILSHNQNMAQDGCNPVDIPSQTLDIILSNQDDKTEHVTGDSVGPPMESSRMQQSEHRSHHYAKGPQETEILDQLQCQAAQVLPQRISEQEETMTQLHEKYEKNSQPIEDSGQKEKKYVQQIQIETSIEPEPRYLENHISQPQLSEPSNIKTSREEQMQEEMQKVNEAVPSLKIKKAKSKEKDKNKSKKPKKKKSDKGSDDETPRNHEAINEVIFTGEDGNILQEGSLSTNLELTNEKQVQKQNISDQENVMNEEPVTGNLVMITSEPQHALQPKTELDYQHQHQIDLDSHTKGSLLHQKDKPEDSITERELVPLKEKTHQKEAQLELKDETQTEGPVDRQIKIQLENQNATQLEDQHQIQYESNPENEVEEHQVSPFYIQCLTVNANEEEAEPILQDLNLKMEHQENQAQVDEQHQIKSEKGIETGNLVLLDVESEDQFENQFEDNNEEYESYVIGCGEITITNQAEEKEIDGAISWSSANIDDVRASDRHSSSEEDYEQNYAEKIEHIDVHGNILFVEYVPLSPQDQTKNDPEMKNSNNLNHGRGNYIETPVITENATRDIFTENITKKELDDSQKGEAQPASKAISDRVSPTLTNSTSNYDLKPTAISEVVIEDTNAENLVELHTVETGETYDQFITDQEHIDATEIRNTPDVILSENKTQENLKDLLPMNSDMKVINENYVDIYSGTVSPSIQKDDSQKRIKGPQDTKWSEGEGVGSFSDRITGIIESNMSLHRNDEQVKEQASLIADSPRQEHELSAPEKPGEVTPMKTKKKKKNKKKQTTDEKIKEPSSSPATQIQQYEENVIQINGSDEKAKGERQLGVILQDVTVTETSTSLHAETTKGNSTEVKDTMIRSSEEPKQATQSNIHGKATKAALKQEPTTEPLSPEQDVRGAYPDIINGMKLMFKQTESLSARNEDEGTIELKQGSMDPVEAALSYMNKKYDYDSEEHSEEVPDMAHTEISAPSARLSTFEIPVMSTFTSSPTDIDSLLYADVNTTSIEFQPESEVQLAEEIEGSEPTVPRISDVQITSTVISHTKQENQQILQNSEHFPTAAMTNQYRQETQKHPGITTDGNVMKIAYNSSTHASDAVFIEEHLETDLNVSPAKEQTMAVVVNPDVMTPVKGKKKKKKKKPARPSRKTQLTDGKMQKSVQVQQTPINSNDISANIYNSTQPIHYESSYPLEEQIDYNLNLSHQTHGETTHNLLEQKPEELTFKSVDQEISDNPPHLSTGISNPTIVTKILKVPKDNGSKSTINGHLVHKLVSSSDHVKGIAQQDQGTHTPTSRHKQSIEAIPNITSDDKGGHRKYEEIGPGFSALSPTISHERNNLSIKENITHLNPKETVLSQEECIMDAVADTDQSQIVAKIDQIILSSLSNVETKYKSQETKNDAPSTPDDLAYQVSTSRFSSRPTDIDSHFLHAHANTTHMQYEPTVGPMEAHTPPDKGFTDAQQMEASLMPQMNQGAQQDPAKDDSSVNNDQVVCNTDPTALNQAQEMSPIPHLLQSVSPRDSMVRVTNLDEYINLYSSRNSQESISLYPNLTSDTAVRDTSKADTLEDKKDIAKIATVDNERPLNCSPSNNDRHLEVPLASQDKRLADNDKGSVTSDTFSHPKTHTSPITQQLQTQTERSLPQKQGQAKMIPSQIFIYPTDQQEQIAVQCQQTFQEEVLPTLREGNQIQSQEIQQETNMPNTPVRMGSEILLSTAEKTEQQEMVKYDSQLPEELTKTELQATNEAQQTPVKKKKSKSKVKDKSKQKTKKSKKKSAEKEPDILVCTDKGVVEEVILAGQGENIPQSKATLSGNKETSNGNLLYEGDVSPGGITVTSTPENEKRQSQNSPSLQKSGTTTSSSNYHYPESTPPSSRCQIMPTQSKYRTFSPTEGDTNENGKEKHDFNLREQTTAGRVQSFLDTPLKPPAFPHIRERSISHTDAPFTSSRESARKGRPLSIPDVYVLLKFDKGSLTNLGVVKKGESSETLPGVSQGIADSNIDSTEPSLRVSHNVSYQTDPSFLDTSEGSHFDFNDSMMTKSMDELDVECTPRQRASNREQQLMRSQSGGALHNTGKSGSRPNQRTLKSGNYDMSYNVMRANQTFDEEEPTKSRRGVGGVQFKALDQVSVYHSQTHVGSPNYRQVTRVAMAQAPVQHSRSKSREHTMPIQRANQEGVNRNNMPYLQGEMRQNTSIDGQLKNVHLPIAHPEVVKQKPPKSPKWGDTAKQKTDLQSKSPTLSDNSTHAADHQSQSHTRREGYQQTLDQPMKSPSWVDRATADHQHVSSKLEYEMRETKQRIGNIQTPGQMKSQSWVDIKTPNHQPRSPTQGDRSTGTSSDVSNMVRRDQQMKSSPWVDIKTTHSQARFSRSNVMTHSNGRIEPGKHSMSSSWVNIQASGHQYQSPTQREGVLETAQSVGDLENKSQHMTSPSWLPIQTPDQQLRSLNHGNTRVEGPWNSGTTPRRDQQLKPPEWVAIQKLDHQSLSPTQRKDSEVLETTQCIDNLQTTDHRMKSPAWMNIQEIPDHRHRSTRGGKQLETARSVGSIPTAHYSMKTPSWMNIQATNQENSVIALSSGSWQSTGAPVRPSQPMPQQQTYQGSYGVAALITHGSMRQPQHSTLSATETLVQQYHQQQQFRGHPFDTTQGHRERHPSAPTATGQHYHALVSSSGTNSSRTSDPVGLGGTLNQSSDTDIW